LEARIQAVIPDVERYITGGMKSFDVPGLAIGIVENDKLVYGKGFGVRAKESGGAVLAVLRVLFDDGQAYDFRREAK
jgi:CubicO group peptidase (beta-lactamase class C family)